MTRRRLRRNLYTRLTTIESEPWLQGAFSADDAPQALTWLSSYSAALAEPTLRFGHFGLACALPIAEIRLKVAHGNH